jgi:hypothetical protein
MGWALAHKGKASEVTYNPDDPPSAYSNPSVHARINMYIEAGRQVHGPDCDPSAHDLGGELIMKVGGEKKHGWYFIGEGTLDTASTPTLAQVQARTTDSGPPIRPRLSVAELRVQEFEVNSDLFIVQSICI